MTALKNSYIIQVISYSISLYHDVGTFLDDKFRAAYNLTYFTMGGIKNVDTSKFRRAIWNYIQCIFGIRHDDYDYGEVNQVSGDSANLTEVLLYLFWFLSLPSCLCVR